MGGASAADIKKKKEEEAQKKARAALEENELPPNWTWDEDNGETYYVNPDGETQWEDPRDDWDTYWPGFME